MSSLNLEKYDEWKDDPDMINDVMRFLDNVLSDFINKAPDQFKDAKYSAASGHAPLSSAKSLEAWFTFS